MRAPISVIISTGRISACNPSNCSKRGLRHRQIFLSQMLAKICRRMNVHNSSSRERVSVPAEENADWMSSRLF